MLDSLKFYFGLFIAVSVGVALFTWGALLTALMAMVGTGTLIIGLIALAIWARHEDAKEDKTED